LRLINTIEATVQSEDPTYLASWDIKRAFDSVPRNLMRIAWKRLGVDSSTVEWLTGLDEGGLTFAWTPHMQDHMEPHSEKFLMSGGAKHFVAAAEKFGFHAHRGIGQGDTMSTVAWIAVFDILLSHCSKFDPNSNLLAYADDLLHISKCLRKFQRITNKISAFCAITGQQISIPKVRAIVINPSPAIKLPQMHMRDVNWTHSTIPIVEAPVLDYLGVQVPLMSTDRSALNWATTYLKTALCNLLARHANPECKLTCGHQTDYAQAPVQDGKGIVASGAL
jgi:hypothetical protein